MLAINIGRAAAQALRQFQQGEINEVQDPYRPDVWGNDVAWKRLL
jgi:hypothetical protein